LNVPERRELGPAAIHFSEVVAVIRDVVEREGRFLALEKLEGGNYRVHRVLGGEEIAMGLYGPSVDVIEDYANLDGAVQAFWSRNEIDGIKILGVPTKHESEQTNPRSLFGGASEGLVPESAPAATTPSDHKIIPGERVGPIRLAASIDEVGSILGPNSWREAPWCWPGSMMRYWVDMGFSVVRDTETGNIVEISVKRDGAGPWPDYWATYRTPEGVCLGSKKRDVISLMGTPERTVSGGGAKSLYYDRRGIRFTILGRWPFARKVGAMRIVWPSVPRGDTLVVPGSRISSIEVGMAIDAVLAALGGGYLKGKSSASFVYYWPHLGLSLVEQSGRAISVRAGSAVSADAPSLLYATTEGLSFGSKASDIRRVYGDSAETGTALGWLWWTYRSEGIAFALDKRSSRVRLLDVFPGKQATTTRSSNS
jgi:hypothetical protein